jgi:adenylate cyclase
MLQDPDGQVLGGIRGKASVLFSDIRGFTTVAEKMSAEQTMDMLNEYFTLMVDEVIREHGLLDKFMGDGLMAVFGVPYAHDEDEVRSVSCALNMLQVLEGHNQARREHGLDALRIGVGIHSDEVISGNMGSAKRMEYTVIGDGVNLAARIEGLNKGYDTSLLISGSTWDSLAGKFVGRRIDNVAVKGRMEPVRVYEVLGREGYQLSTAQQAFVKGLEYYGQRAFEQALESFRSGAREDGPCAAFVARCEHYIRTPPSPEWDGAWQATSK